MYQEFFTGDNFQDSVNLNEQHSAISFQFGEVDPSADMESKLSPEALASNLGFLDGLPFLFARHRHRGGITSWDSGKGHLFEAAKADENPDMNRNALHWHQLYGVHKQVRLFFTPEPQAARPCGILVADEVGLGKTYQAIAMIAFLTDLVMRQKVGGKMPPIIGGSASPKVRGSC